jgi:hypothetical protein
MVKIRNNESGIILVTVLLVTIILSILAVGILSQNVSQVKTEQSVVDQIKAEYLAKGAFNYDYQKSVTGEVGPSPSPTVLDGKTFTITTTSTTTGCNNLTCYHSTFDIGY